MNNKIFTYAIITPPGLEKVCLEELQEKWGKYFDSPLPQTQLVSKGLIEFTAEEMSSVLLNQILRTPTRILLRLGAFKCKDFPKLYNKVKKFEWGQFLYSNKVNIKATSKKSKLLHSGRIEKTASDAIQTWLKGNPRKKSIYSDSPQEVYFRFDDDLCTISVDTSGAPLYKRGERKGLSGASAPLRETIAAGMWKFIQSKNLSFDELVDPMCGSGTLLWEAQNFNQVVIRDFAFEGMSIFKKVKKFNPSEIKYEFKCVGIDQNKNLVSIHEQYENSEFEYQDFFKIKPTEKKRRIFVCNPPYGERLQKGNSLRSLYHKLIEHCFSEWNAQGVGILIPSKDLPKLSRKVQKVNLSNGGIPVTFMWVEKD